jgi:uncharacterized RDD family membrane protein YckC
MNKETFSSFLSSLFWTIVFLSAPVLPLSGQEDLHPALSTTIAVPVMWTSGNDRGVYLLLAREQQQTPGYQLYFRDLVRDTFLPDFGYSGIPDVVVMHQDRLMVFLQGGGCQSYSLNTEPQTERRLPAGLRILDCSSQDEALYALALIEKPVENIPALSTMVPVQPSPSSSDANEPMPAAKDSEKIEADQKTPSLSVGEYVILQRGLDKEWRCLSVGSFPLPPLSKLHMAAHGETIHLFGIPAGDANSMDSTDQIQHFQLQKHILSPVEILSLDQAYDLSVLNVNRQLLLIAFTESDSVSADGTTGRVTQVQLGWQNGNTWQFSPLLADKNGQVFTVQRDHAAFTAFGQNIAFFQWESDKEVRFGYFSPHAKTITVDNQPIRAVGQTPFPLLKWAENPTVGITLMVAAGAILFWRRKQIFSPADPLPDYIHVAPLWRRLVAFFLDIFVISMFLQILLFIANILAPEKLRPLQMDPYSLEQLQQGIIDPFVGKLLLVFFAVVILYFFVFEMFFGTTAGKLALGLVILGQDGKPIRRWQVFIRDMLRILEFHPQMFFPVFLVVLFTRNKQRFGDLAAQTIIVMNTPELKARMMSASRSDSSPDEKEHSEREN